MLSPVLHCNNNCAELVFYTRFGEKKTYSLAKRDGQAFRLGYTGISEIVRFKAYVYAIFEDFVVLRTKNFMPIYALYGEDLTIGQEIYVMEYFPVTNSRLKWVASSMYYRDVKCVHINVDTLYKGEVVHQFKIDPFTGQSKAISWH